MMKSLMSQYRFILLLLVFPVPGVASAGNPLNPPLFSMQTVIWQPGVVFCVVAGSLLAAVSVSITYFVVSKRLNIEIISHKETTTKLRKAYELLIKEKERMQLYLDMAGTIILVIGNDNKIQLINKKGCKTLEHNYTEIMYKNWFDTFVLREDKERCLQFIDQMEHGLITGNGKIEYRVVTHSGRYRRILWEKVILYDDKNVRLGILCSGEDITERLKVAEELQKNEEFYRTLFTLASDAIIIVENDCIVDCNTKALEIFECGSEQIIGQSPSRFYPEKQPNGAVSLELAKERLEKLVNNEPSFFEWQYCRYDYSLFDAEVGVTLIDLTNTRYQLIFVRDISNRKEAENKMKRNLDELARFSKLAVGREKEMVHLKSEVNDLLKELGFSAKYKIVH